MATHRIIFTPSGIQTTGETGESLYEAALRVGADLQSICGGKGLCKRCQCEIETGDFAKFKIKVGEGELPKLSPTEKKARHDGELTAERRLACRAKIRSDLVVNIPADARERETAIEKKSTPFETALNPAVRLYMVQLPKPELHDNPSDGEALCAAIHKEHGIKACASHRALIKLQRILAKHERTVTAVVRGNAEIIDVHPPSPIDLYGAAIDIGSTSVALYMFNLSSGALVYEKAAMNPQIRFGEDLMSRVSYIMMNKGGEGKLIGAIRGQIAEMLADARQSLEIGSDQLLDVICVGNPIMHHLFIGANPVELGQAPFTLAVKDWLDIPGSSLDIGLSGAATVSMFPLIGGHVGADTAAAYLTQMDKMKTGSVLLVDIGTNAEIVLSHNGKVAAASSPTGPALEGAEITCGVRASLGAIERVRIDPESFAARVKIIGHDEWLSEEDAHARTVTGICGSGIFEVMTELAAAGLIDQSGLFRPEQSPDRFSRSAGVWQFTLLDLPGGPIIIKQTDIRAVQLAKAALFAGAQLVAETLGCTHFDEVLLAGAFGTHLDPKSVADIGIVPFANAEIIRPIGNAAGMGAAMALLNTGERAKIIDAVQQIEKIETALEPRFQDYFVAAMKFPGARAAAPNPNRRRRRRTQSA